MDPRVGELIRRWSAALGGSERVAAIDAVSIRGRVRAGGLDGEYREWWCADGRLRQEVALGDVMRQSIVFDGAAATVRDGEGIVRPLSGAELQDLISTVHLRTFSHLLPGRRDGVLEDLGIDAEGRPGLRILPAGGKPVTVRLDPVSGRPLQQETQVAERTRVIQFEDWREVDGVEMPFGWRESTGDPRFDTTFEVVEIEFGAEHPPELFEHPLELPPEGALPGPVGPWTPIVLNGSHVFLPVTIQAQEPIEALLDTGAGHTVLDTGCAARLGLESQGALEARGAGAEAVTASVVTGVRLSLAGGELVDRTLVVLALSPLEPKLGRSLDGIVGYDCISRFVVQVDYHGGRLRLHDPRSWAPPPEATVVTIAIDGNHPYVEATIDIDGGEPLIGRFLVDTGADLSLLLTTPFVERHQLLGRVARRVAHYGGGVGGDVVNQVGRIRRLQLGDQVLDAPLVVFANAAKGAIASPDFAGIIGGEVLRRFDVWFDYRGRRMALAANPDRARSFEHDMSGLQLVGDGSGFRVEHRLEEGPGAAAGLQIGDRITHIDGVPAADLRLATVREAWRKDGHRCRLRVERAATTVEIDLPCRRLV